MLRRMGSRQWVILLLLGLLLTVIALPVSDKKEEKAESAGSARSFLTGTGEEQDNISKTELEEKLEALLSSVEGVGKVQVILMTGEDNDSREFYHSGTEKITGVLIAAQGADNGVVSQNIVQAVMALFQVEAHKIKVMKMK
ncbi:hypothetical protein [Ruminococcus sp. 5_1_39BFAA]|uniref:hypothetical protein n=1 Tax=Ruminococcus sp. 5_1_39BFAA TaxID=457412 RepID=UPI003567D3BA